MIAKGFTEPTERIKRLKKAFVAAVPEVESERAVLVTESYRETEGMPILCLLYTSPSWHCMECRCRLRINERRCDTLGYGYKSN